MNLYLPFSPDINCGITLGFAGKRENFLGGKLGEMLKLSPKESVTPDLTFSEENIAGESVLKHIYGEFDISESADGIHIRQLPREQHVKCNGLLTMKQMLPCAVRQSWKKGIKTALFHGAMLTHPEHPGQCVLIFGISGMGKSTTAKRWQNAGGDAAADDMVLVYQNENGDFFARPLPTWSHYPEAVNFNNCYKVNAVLRLQRGEEDAVIVADALSWAVDCNKALMFHHYLPNLRQNISTMIAIECMCFGENLRQKFDEYDLSTNLDGNLYPALTGLFR